MKFLMVRARSCDQKSQNLLKYIYSEKATKFCEIFPLLLTAVHTVKSKGKISQKFVAFSEYMKFNIKLLSLAYYSLNSKISKKDNLSDQKYNLSMSKRQTNFQNFWILNHFFRNPISIYSNQGRADYTHQLLLPPPPHSVLNRR